MRVSLTVNGKREDVDVEPRVLLVHLLRENLSLTGTHVGCDTSQCGACTVFMDGQSVKSCTVFAVQADGADVLTIEGEAVHHAVAVERIGVGDRRIGGIGPVTQIGPGNLARDLAAYDQIVDAELVDDWGVPVLQEGIGPVGCSNDPLGQQRAAQSEMTCEH